jgi:hypothetical protein
MRIIRSLYEVGSPSRSNQTCFPTRNFSRLSNPRIGLVLNESLLSSPFQDVESLTWDQFSAGVAKKLKLPSLPEGTILTFEDQSGRTVRLEDDDDVELMIEVLQEKGRDLTIKCQLPSYLSSRSSMASSPTTAVPTSRPSNGHIHAHEAAPDTVLMQEIVAPFAPVVLVANKSELKEEGKLWAP